MHYHTGRRARRGSATLATAIIFLWGFFIPGGGSAASTHENATLLLRVDPAAMLQIVPASPPSGVASQDAVLWFHVELAIRMLPGGTAWLRLDPASGGLPDGGPSAISVGAPQPPVFTARRNGRYQFRIGVRPPNPSAPQPLRFVLESSDRTIYITRSL